MPNDPYLKGKINLHRKSWKALSGEIILGIAQIFLDFYNQFKITNDERMVKYYIQSYETLLDHIFKHCSEVK